MLEALLAKLIADFGKEMVKIYLDRKDTWDRIEGEIEGKAKDHAIKALEYLARRGDLTFKLRPDAGEIELL